MAWRYFNSTGKTGGGGTDTIYIDSYKGSDSTGTGTHLLPYKTIQKGIDEASYSGRVVGITGTDLILTGRFKEGDFVTSRRQNSIIAEGDVYLISPSGTATFDTVVSGAGNGQQFNISTYDNFTLKDYGKLHFEGYDRISFGLGYTSDYITYEVDMSGVYNCVFKDIIFRVGVGVYAGHSRIIKKCIFDNTEIYMYAHLSNGNHPSGSSTVENCNFINGGNVIYWSGYASGLDFRDNYGDSTFTYYDSASVNTGTSVTRMYNNHIEGSSADKFKWYTSAGYTDLDAVQAAQGNVYDNVPYANSPQFNGLNSGDYTYDNVSPNATGGWAGGPIGAYGVGYSTKTLDAVGEWSLSNISITGTGSNSVANLTTSGTGSLTEIKGVQIGFGEDVYIGPVLLPSMIQDFANGEVVDKTKSADGVTASVPTIEIEYSLDSTDGVDGTWSGLIEVPIGVTPMVDGSGKGSGDNTFDPSTANRIPARWVRSKITLRDDEVPLL
jgi:hypothetical protein